MSHEEWPLYEVFIRSKSGLSHKHAGSVHAADDQMALDHARDIAGEDGAPKLLIARLPLVSQ